MGGRDTDVEAWLTALPDHQRPQVGQLADLTRATADDLEESVKWGRLTFTVDGDWHHWLCAIGATKTETKLMFHKGALLEDPAGLLEGDGRHVRYVRHDVATAHPEAVMRLVQEAIHGDRSSGRSWLGLRSLWLMESRTDRSLVAVDRDEACYLVEGELACGQP